jgi:hypothetical protein
MKRTIFIVALAHILAGQSAAKADSRIARLLGLMFVLCLVGQPSFGDDSNKVLGTWKLVSYETEVQATGEKEPAMGKNPTGYVVFNAERRVFLLLTGEARKPAKTSQERAELFATLVAYTGIYRVEGDKWTTKVEVAWISRVGRHRTSPNSHGGR